MTSPSKLQTGILTREWVVYPVLTSMSRLKRGSCRIQKLIKYRQGHCLQANKRCDRILGNIFNQYRVSQQHYKHIKSFRMILLIFTNMYFRSLKLFKSHFLLTAKKKCLLLCNLPCVIIYLVNMKTIA